MSQPSAEQAPKPQDPELAESQIAVKGLCDEILALRPPNYPLTSIQFNCQVDPENVQQRLRNSALGQLMLNDGDTLSATPSSRYYPELDLFVGSAKLIGAGVTGWGWQHKKYRIDPNSPPEARDIIHYPDEKDWSHQLDIKLWYANKYTLASQTLTAYTASTQAGQLPLLLRDVSSPAYAEMGYEGHNQAFYTPHNDAEVLFFVDLARELFAARVTPNFDK